MSTIGAKIFDAAENGKIAQMNDLLKGATKADVNWTDQYLQSSLIRAARNGHTEITEMLLAAGSNINYQTGNGWTALMLAAQQGRAGPLRVLLEADAKTSLRNKDGKAAADLAKTEEIRKMINAGKDPDAFLELQCDTLTMQVAQASSRRDAIKRKEALQALLSAAMTKGDDFKAIKAHCTALETLQKESQQLPLSEEAYLSLPTRHAALVQRMGARCIKLMEDDHAEALVKLGPKLTALKALKLPGEVQAKGTTVAPFDAVKLQRLQENCSAFVKEMSPAGSHLRRALQHRSPSLVVKIDQARAARPPDYALLGQLLQEQIAWSRGVSLMTDVTQMLEDLKRAQQYKSLSSLTSQLEALQGLGLVGDAITQAKFPKIGAVVPHDAPKLARLQAECATVRRQAAEASARRGWEARRTAAEEAVARAKAAKDVDFGLVGKLLLDKKAVDKEGASLKVSESEYATLFNRWTALKAEVQMMNEELARAQQYGLLIELGGQLEALCALDLSALRGYKSNPPPKAAPAPSAAGGVSPEEENGDFDPMPVPAADRDSCENDPIWVSSAMAAAAFAAGGGSADAKNMAPGKGITESVGAGTNKKGKDPNKPKKSKGKEEGKCVIQ